MNTMRYGGMIYQTGKGMTYSAWGNGALSAEENAACLARAFDALEAELRHRGHLGAVRVQAPATMPGTPELPGMPPMPQGTSVGGGRRFDAGQGGAYG